MKTRLIAFAASAIAALALGATSAAADVPIPATSVTLTPSVASPGTVGSTITFTAAANGGSGQYEYQYYLRMPGGPQSLVRSYSTTASWTWNTSGLAPGTYNVAVLARNVGSTKSYETYRGLNYVLAAPASLVTLAANMASPAWIGSTVVFTAAASGGSGKYEYQYYLRAPGGSQVLVRSYSTTASWSWNTSGLAPGTYNVAVLARNVGSTKSYETYRGLNYVLATPPPASAVTLSPNVASPSGIGGSVIFTAAASGGSGKYEYQYYLRAPGGAQLLVRSYSTAASWSWNTSGLAPGTYNVAVLARNVGSTKSYETYRGLNYVLATPASAVTLTPSVASPANIGSTVVFTAAASGGSGKYEYQFYLRVPGGTQTLVRSYSTTTSWSWNTTALAAGTYQVAVLVRNVGSTKSYETYRAINYGLATSTSTLSKFASIDVGDMTACAVGVDGRAWCWGPNDFGQLATGDTAQGNVPRRAAEGYAFRKVSVSTGGGHACGITTAGRAYCWGNQEGGRLGDGIKAPSGQYVTAPVPVSGDRTYTDIAAGGDHVCAIATGGAGYCWGHNSRGQLGTGNQIDSTVPVAITGGLTFTSITTHQLVTCGVTTVGSAYCWGYGEAGNLGSGSKSDSSVPVPVKGGLSFSSLRLGLWTACGVTTAGDGYCWGYNFSGELGIGSETPEQSFEPANKVAGGHKWKSISPGISVTCGVTTAGGGFCWGENAWGERGDGPFPSADVTSPVPVVGNLIFDSIDVDWTTCGVASGVAYCWGMGELGSIGDGALVNRGVPTRVAGQQ